jgi:uncharacterized membrane protein YfcA
LKTVLFVILGILTIVFVVVWATGIRRIRKDGSGEIPGPGHLLIGFVTNFFDTLGIGSFATTTSVFKFWKIVPDEVIPGTLNVGHTLPIVTQAFIYVALIKVDALTLAALIAAAVAGAWAGAPIVAGWPRRAVQIGLGAVLIAAAALMLMSQLHLLPIGGTGFELRGMNLGLGIFGSFWLGALMTLGLGFYAPCMILVSLLGMNPTASFPIMMGACAFLMPTASMRFIGRERYSLRPALGLALGGIPGVLLAAFVVRSLSLSAVRWLVVCVVVYAATALLRSAVSERKRASQAPPG